MMASKPTYEELEKKVKKLKKRDVTYNQAKQSVKKSLEKQGGPSKDNSEPEMAVEVIEQEDAIHSLTGHKESSIRLKMISIWL